MDKVDKGARLEFLGKLHVLGIDEWCSKSQDHSAACHEPAPVSPCLCVADSGNSSLAPYTYGFLRTF